MSDIDELNLVHRTEQAIKAAWAADPATTDTTPNPRQTAVLFAIARKFAPGYRPSQTELVTVTGIDRSTLADIIRRLLQRGLLERRRTKEDARAYAIKLTSTGELELANALKIAGRVNTVVKSTVPGLASFVEKASKQLEAA